MCALIVALLLVVPVVLLFPVVLGGVIPGMIALAILGLCSLILFLFNVD